MQMHSGTTETARRSGLTLLAGLVGGIAGVTVVIGLFFAVLVFVLRSPLDIRASERAAPALALRATLPIPEPPRPPVVVADSDLMPPSPTKDAAVVAAPVQRAELPPVTPEVAAVPEPKPEPAPAGDPPVVTPPAQTAAVAPEPAPAPTPSPEPQVTGTTPPIGVGGPFVPAPPQAEPEQIVQLAALPRPKPEPKTKRARAKAAKAAAKAAKPAAKPTAKPAAKPARKAERPRKPARARNTARSGGSSGNAFDTFSLGGDTSANTRNTRRSSAARQRPLGSDDFGRISGGN